MVLVLWVLLTGGLHWDGLADIADGLGGGRDPASRLEIMKDSRIGAFGALALICGLVLKGVFLRLLFSQYGSFLPLLGILILIGSTARGGQVLGIFLFPYARKEGMGRFFKERTGTRHLLAAVATVLLLATGLYGVVGGLIALGGLAAAVVAGLCLSAPLGGLTGDAYGALTEGGEILLLLAVTALPREFLEPGLLLGGGL